MLRLLHHLIPHLSGRPLQSQHTRHGLLRDRVPLLPPITYCTEPSTLHPSRCFDSSHLVSAWSLSRPHELLQRRLQYQVGSFICSLWFLSTYQTFAGPLISTTSIYRHLALQSSRFYDILLLKIATIAM